MNKLLLSMALATVVVTPSLAQSYDPDVGSGNIAPLVHQAPASPHWAAHRGFALAVTRGVIEPWGTVANDPDPSVRNALVRAAEADAL